MYLLLISPFHSLQWAFCGPFQLGLKVLQFWKTVGLLFIISFLCFTNFYWSAYWYVGPPDLICLLSLFYFLPHLKFISSFFCAAYWNFSSTFASHYYICFCMSVLFFYFQQIVLFYKSSLSNSILSFFNNEI